MIDDEGKPISGAKVYAISLSMAAGPAFTGSDGRVTLPDLWAQRVEWVSASAPGYLSSTVDLTEAGPVRVTLAPETTYAFMGTLISVVPSVEGRVFLTDTPDPRWVAEFRIERVVNGTPPAAVGGTVRYAIHSPARFGIDGAAGRAFSVQGNVTESRVSPRHMIRIEARP